MPSLAESLDALAHHSEQIAYLSTLNAAPPGPFTAAYLHLPPPHLSHLGKGNVLELIRDASDAERRLFKFVGENNLPGVVGGGGNKRVEKREGGVVTPLKELKRRGGGSGGGGTEKDEVEVMLRTALKLVDDYRPMPRARAHVINLLDQHHQNLDRLAELEMLIAEANKPVDVPASPSPQPEESEEPRQEPVKLTPEEAIKAEEAALRALEAKIIPLRSVSQPSQDEQPLKPQDMVPPMGRNIPQSPPSQPQPQFEPQPTPSQAQSASAQPRTPGRSMPHVTNSLVNATPRHAIERLERTERIDRFSPLKLITPRAPGALRGEGIFGRRMGSSSASSSKLGGGLGTSMGKRSSDEGAVETSHTPAPAIVDVPSTPSKDAPDQIAAGIDPDETVRLTQAPSPSNPIKAAAAEFPPPSSPPRKVHLPVEELAQPVPDTDILAQTPQICADNKLDGVDTGAEAVRAGVEKIWSNVGDLMRQGLENGQTVEKDTASSVRHLIHLSNSNLPPPPSPSTSSSLSSLSHGGMPPPKPITSETILFAHLFLSILRASSNSERSPGEVDMNEVKESLGNVAKERGWDGAGGLGTKVIYAAVGKRVVKIERKGGGAGRVRFAD
ncbi:hypothetical protein C362_04015 [Cryptococcus neoformans Bt1]|nr:hypothetical protein C362_04015 [Cryptococcus neoformans var. grubii Bt1]